MNTYDFQVPGSIFPMKKCFSGPGVNSPYTLSCLEQGRDWLLLLLLSIYDSLLRHFASSMPFPCPQAVLDTRVQLPATITARVHAAWPPRQAETQ